MNVPVVDQRLYQLLQSRGLVGEDQLQICLQEQRKTGSPLEKILVDFGFLSEAVLLDLAGEATGSNSISLASILPDAAALKLVPRDLAVRNNLVPVSLAGDVLSVAVEDIYDLQASDRLRTHVGAAVSVELLLAPEREIAETIDRFYGFELSVDGILREIETGEIDYDGLSSNADEYSQPFVRLVDSILADAIKRRASDVHFEPEAGFLRVRYRIDGVLRQIRSFHIDYWPALTVRLKVVAGLNIAETRMAQDGRMSLAFAGGLIEFRVSKLPTVYGENIVLRILDRDKGILSLDKLGLPEDTQTTLKLMMARPEGLILVTGPTGSGKTTTLYSILKEINTEQVNIMTMEDPVEYPLPMVRQSSLNEQAKLTYADGIRAIMRQDPDIILVGEIRDEETAGMAFRASMTGHQVYSTLHSNSAVGSIARLRDIGVAPGVLVGNIIGIIAQRLVRRLCVHCAEAYQPDAMEQKILGVLANQQGEITDPPMTICRAGKCGRCDYQGYRGRLALMEVLRFTADVDELISQDATSSQLLQAAQRNGFITLSDDALRRVREGVTTIEEVARVIDFTNLV